jgi:starch phosphorylase
MSCWSTRIWTYPRTFIFGAKAAAGYENAKLTIKLINAVGDVVNHDPAIKGKLKVVFIEDYKVSNAELLFAAADVSEQISTASKEASGTGNMKFMLNGAVTIGTMDGANVEMVEEMGEENAVIFGMSAEEVIEHERVRDYDPMEVFNTDPNVRRVVMQLINGRFSGSDTELFRRVYDSLLNTKSSMFADTYFILKDFESYRQAQEKINAYYQDEKKWAKMAIMNTACSGKFSSDRTIQEYVDEIWELKPIQ